MEKKVVKESHGKSGNLVKLAAVRQSQGQWGENLIPKSSSSMGEFSDKVKSAQCYIAACSIYMVRES